MADVKLCIHVHVFCQYCIHGPKFIHFRRKYIEYQTYKYLQNPLNVQNPFLVYNRTFLEMLVYANMQLTKLLSSLTTHF